MNNRTNILLIRTPEGIVFSQTIASPVARFMAWILDFLCIAGATILLNIIVGMLLVFTPDIAQAVSIVLFFAISIGYAMATEWYWRGQTVGKRAFRLRVVDAQGLRLQPAQVIVRNLLRAIDALPFFYLVGGITCLSNRKGQRLGDLVANTVVVYTPKVVQPDVSQILAGKFNSLRNYPHIEARLRQRVSPAEAMIALQAIQRRDSLDDNARVELFRAIATHFHSLVTVPPEVLEGIADEQFVRNVVDVIYRKQSTVFVGASSAGSRSS